MFKRSSGILIHISSLPSDYGIGDFGLGAYEFIDFLERSGQKLWQILPMGQTGYGDSPYQSFSAFAGNPYFIDLNKFIEKGYLKEEDLKILKENNNSEKVDYDFLYYNKYPILKKAYEKFCELGGSKEQEEMVKFKEENKYWIEDYCLYMALKSKYNNKSWQKWPKKLKFRDKKVLENMKLTLDYEMNFYLFLQHNFYQQWKKLRDYANSKKIKIIGDIPIFIAEDSADAWSKGKLFAFDKYKKPKKVAGCPPDDFSADGQLWGNPLYNWEYNKKTGYEWWVERIKSCFELYDIVRIDHFRGFDSYWAIRAGRKNARKGRWEKGPGIDLFNKIKKRLGNLPIIAEDLGFLTPSVEKLLADSGYPGMKIFEFGFYGTDEELKENPYLPHMYPENSSAYIGTHDNSTAIGWYETLDKSIKKRCDEYLSKMEGVTSEETNIKMVEGLFSSKALITVVQMQDILGLNDTARMNIPGTPSGNWQWRMKKDYITKELEGKLKKITTKFER